MKDENKEPEFIPYLVDTSVLINKSREIRIKGEYVSKELSKITGKIDDILKRFNLA